MEHEQVRRVDRVWPIYATGNDHPERRIPGSVMSMPDSPAVSSSDSLRASNAEVTCSLSALSCWPTTFFCSVGAWPISDIFAFTTPLEPSHLIRNCSSASLELAAASSE